MAKASIQIDVTYSVPGGEAGRASVDTEMPENSGKGLSGSGDSDGARSTLVTEAAGAETTTEDHDRIPDNATVTAASISISLNCPGAAAPISLQDRANHSVEGRVDGNCIETIAVNKVENGTRVVTTTRKKRRCCGEGAKIALADQVRDELVIFKDEIKTLIDSKLDGPATTKPKPDTKVWFGLRFSPEEDGLVEQVIADSPSEDEGIKPGDQVVAINEVSLEELGGVSAFLGEQSSFEPVAFKLKRVGKSLNVEIRPAPRLAASADIIGAFSMDRACGDDCECSKRVKRSLCGKVWRYMGDGPHGGVVYEELCITIEAGNPDPIEHSCGAGEYF